MSVQAIEFDFGIRQDRKISCDEVRSSIADGKSCWIDLDWGASSEAEKVLQDLGFGEAVIDSESEKQSVGRYDVYENFLHITIAAPKLIDGRVAFDFIDVILAERLLLTVHRGPSVVLQRVEQGYAKFLRTFAQSLGFLLFEIWDAMIDTHRRVFTELEDKVERTQSSIFHQTDDQIFTGVADVTADLLYLRKNVTAVRETLDHLATHKSAFVTESTQPFLRNMVGILDRLSGDLTVEREILAESLTLYLGIVAHRTNRLLHRLTLVSVIFMPLMFLCGVYGMNFDLPEFSWRYGYAYFWTTAAVVVIAMAALMRVRKLW